MIRPIQTHECPNAVCSVCRLATRSEPRLVSATHEVRRVNLRYYVCAPHAEVAALWGRLTRRGAGPAR